MSQRIVEPPGWERPHGYSDGLLCRGQILFVSGQVGWNTSQKFETDDFVEQFRQALENVIAVVKAAGGKVDDVARLTIYILDKLEYRARIKEVGVAYRSVFGKHYPAMALLEVKGLLEDRAKVEIEATAAIDEPT
jgi:enamine deaminase RidA (YjgF/YER057c/UK114 family)